MKNALLCTTLFASCMLSLTGCGLLLGNMRPIEEKSTHYRIQSLSGEWALLTSITDNPGDQADLSFQSKTTGSIISINSACRPGFESRPLEHFSTQILLGISEIAERKNQPHPQQGLEGLETTLMGQLGKKPVKIQTIVLRKGHCIYDLMYVAKPETFDLEHPVFTQFSNSLIPR